MALVTAGLVGAWDLTGQSAGTQSVAGAHGTSYAIQMGSTSGAEGDDPALISADGMRLDGGGPDDQLIATTMPDTGLLGDISIVVIANCLVTTAFGIIGTATGNAMPFDFYNNGTALELRRGNTGIRSFTGPAVVAGAYRIYTVVAASGVENTPNFYIGSTKTVGSAGSGSATGVALTAAPMTVRVGKQQWGGTLAGAMTVSYVMLYGSLLSDVDVEDNEAYFVATLPSLGLPNPDAKPAYYYAQTQGLQ